MEKAKNSPRFFRTTQLDELIKQRNFCCACCLDRDKEDCTVCINAEYHDLQQAIGEQDPKSIIRSHKKERKIKPWKTLKKLLGFSS